MCLQFRRGIVRFRGVYENVINACTLAGCSKRIFKISMEKTLTKTIDDYQSKLDSIDQSRS